VRAIDISLQRSDSQGAGGKGGIVNDVTLLSTNGSVNSDYTNLLGILTSQAGTVAKAAQVGAAVKFVSASASTVGLSQTFDRLLAIGYLGFDVQVNTNGELGTPIPTFQHLKGNNSGLPTTTFGVATENYMAIVSNGYHAATNQVEWDKVILNTTGKTNFIDLVRTGTNQDWNNTYYALKNRSLLP